MSIEKVAVIGAGQMGRGIAQVFATAGKDVTIVDINDAIIANSEAALDKGYAQAGFTLYKDAACTIPAKNIYNATIPANQLTDANGQARFADLRHGTYYLKETTAPQGFEAMDPNPLEVTIDGGPGILRRPDRPEPGRRDRPGRGGRHGRAHLCQERPVRRGRHGRPGGGGL